MSVLQLLVLSLLEAAPELLSTVTCSANSHPSLSRPVLSAPAPCQSSAVQQAASFAPAWHPLHAGLTPLSLVQSPPNPHPQCCFLPRTHTPTGWLDWSVISLYAIVKCLSGQDLCQ